MVRLSVKLAMIASSLVTCAARDPTNKAGEDFLEQNQNAPDVKLGPKGLQYRMDINGTGWHHAKNDADVRVNYRGSLLDGSVFDDSYSRKEKPMFNSKGMIIALSEAPALRKDIVQLLFEALEQMTEGAKWTIWLPSHLGFGTEGADKEKMNVRVPIGPGEILIFELEMLKIEGPKRRAHQFLCRLGTHETCMEDELEWLQNYENGTKEEATTELKRCEEIYLQEEPLKVVDREHWERGVKLLKRILKRQRKALKASKQALQGNSVAPDDAEDDPDLADDIVDSESRPAEEL